MSVQFILEEILCTIRAYDGHALSPEAMRQLISGCVRAVTDMQARAEQVRREQGVEDAVGLQGRED
jgi:hypothetical protein